MAGMNDLMTRLLLNTGNFDSNLAKSTKQVQEFQKNAQAIGSKFSSGLGVLSKFAPQLAALTGGFAAFNATINSSEGMIDKWGETCRAANTTVGAFFTSITTGDFSNFLNGLESIIKSAKEAYKEIDNLGTMIAFQDTEIAKIESRRIDLEYRIKLGKSKGEDVSALQDELLGTNEEIASLMKERAEQATKAWKAAVKEAVQKQTGGWYDEITASKYSNWADFKTLSKEGLNAEEKDIEKRKKALGSTYDYALVNLKAYQKLQAEGRLNEKGQDALQLINDERVYQTKRAILDQESKITEANKYQVAASQALAKAANSRKESLRYTEDNSSTKTKSTTSNKELSFIEGAKTLNEMQNNVTYLQNQLNNLDVSSLEFAEVSDELDIWIEKIKIAKGELSTVPEPLKDIKTKTQAVKDNSDEVNASIYKMTVLTKATSNAFGAVNDNGVQAFANILQSTIPLIGAIMALAIAEGEENAARTSKNWVELIAATVSVGATIAGTFAALKDAGKYANGGIIGGNSYSGDKLIAHVNSGEMILNKRQQGNLFNILSNGTGIGSNSQVQFKIQGKELVGVLNNYNSKYGKI